MAGINSRDRTYRLQSNQDNNDIAAKNSHK